MFFVVDRYYHGGRYQTSSRLWAFIDILLSFVNLMKEPISACSSLWSLYLAELYKNLFEDFEVRNAQFGLTDTTLVFRVVVSVEDDDYSCRNKEVTSEERYRAGSVSDA